MRQWLGLLLRAVRGPNACRAHDPQRRRVTFRPALEILEDRTLPSVRGVVLAPQFVENTPSVQPAVAQVTLGDPATINGSTAEWSNPAGDFQLVTGDIDWGDGVSSQALFSYPPNNMRSSVLLVTAGLVHGNTPTPTFHGYQEEGRYSSTLTLHETSGSAAAPGHVTHSTLVLKGQAVVADASLVLEEGSDLQLVSNSQAPVAGRVSFTDLGGDPLGAFSATVDWGDHSGQRPGKITPLGHPGLYDVALGSHPYAADGTYTVNVQINDRGGSSLHWTEQVHVIDPFVVLTTSPQTLVTKQVHFDVAVSQYYGTTPPTSYTLDVKPLEADVWSPLHTGAWSGSFNSGQGHTTWDFWAPQVGNFLIRVAVTTPGGSLRFSSLFVQVLFPTPQEIMKDLDVQVRTDAAWKDTWTFTALWKNRREEGFWILYNTAKHHYEFTPVVNGSILPPGVEDSATVELGKVPADRPAADPWTMVYTVASFHTHTPSTFRDPAKVVKRPIGPSADDLSLAQTYWHVPGLVYDYVKPHGPGDLLLMPATLYPYGAQRPLP